jgi:group I intron endonuclease
MFYYLYQITNLVNNKIYVGVHKTKNMNDGYMGSGKVIVNAIEKYGINNFKKDILETFENAEAMYAREKEIVTDEFLLREDVYNLRRGGHGGFDYINANRTSDEWSNLGKLGSAKSSKNKGKKFNQTWRNNISKSLVGRVGVFVGKQHSEESKKKIGIKNSKNQIGNGNSQFGTMWITNNFENKKIKKSDNIPEGWKKGRIIR